MADFNGSDIQNILTGTNGNDVILGYSGNDTLYGHDGDDTFFVVDDINFVEKIWGTEDSDTMIGGKGNDNYFVDDTKDYVAERYNEGIDNVYTTLDSYALPQNIENAWLILYGHKDLYGNYLNNYLCGNCGYNFISGYAGDDTILGGGYGHDTLSGGDGDDYLHASISGCQLYGDAGDDTLTGGYKNDTLSGGDGNDRYTGFNLNLANEGSAFKVGYGHDVIQDYAGDSADTVNNYGYDVINLNEFSLDQIYLKGIDTDKDSNLDCLYVYCKGYGSIEIDHYFDDTSKIISNLHPGEGCIEAIVLNQQVLDYDDVLNYMH